MIRRNQMPTQYELGRMCKEGIGTIADSKSSEEWYKRAYNGFLLN